MKPKHAPVEQNYAYENPENFMVQGEQWRYDRSATVISLFNQQAVLNPDRTAVVFDSAVVSYDTLHRRSNQMAHYLLEQGVKPGDIIPVWIDRSVEWLVAVTGILKTGAAYVPIDPSYPLKRVQVILEDTGTSRVITTSKHTLPDAGKYHYVMLDSLGSLDEWPDALPEVPVTADDRAYIIYTSGSTGMPKGVMVAHRSLQHLVTWHQQRFEVTANDRVTLVAGIAFDISVWEIWTALTTGATLVIASNEERTDAAALLQFYTRHGITHAFVPTVLAPEVVALSRSVPHLHLRYLFTGGEKLKPVRTHGLDYQLVDYYGPTEYSIFATCRIVRDENGEYVPSIGQPVANTQAYILNQHLQPVPAGGIGELYLGGEGLALGYWNRPAQTAASFIDHPFIPGARLYKTGDLVSLLPSGELTFSGRVDNQVKIRGFRIELGEIEKVLLPIDGIKDVAVITRDDEKQHKYIVAFLVKNWEAAAPEIAAIRAVLKEALPGYMIPSQFIFLDKIPVTPNGKTDQARLSQLAAAYEEEAVYEPPVTDMEITVAAIWESVLGRKAINNTDNFFDIGGNSVRVAPVVTALGRRLSLKVYMRDVYQFPVLKDLAQTLTARQAQADTIVMEEDVEPYIALQQDVYLKPGTVIRRDFDIIRLQNPGAILLTGVTGFVGIHLLKDLLLASNAKVYCLIRASNEYYAMERINGYLNNYHIHLDESLRQRIIPVTGDFSKPDMGLTETGFKELADTIDVIYHSGSSVNFIEPYSFMKSANVEGLREIISFAAAGKTKCLVLLSTISVYSWGHVFTHKTVMKETDDIGQNLLAVSKDIGYVRSKWVMEGIADLAAAQGLPVITYRLGYAMCHSETGASAPYQWWAGLVKNCVEFNAYPALKELREGLITVDYMTKAIAYISKKETALGLKFNLIASPETNLTLQQFFDLLNKYYSFDLRGLPYKEWRKIWEDDPANRLYALTSLFKDNMHEGLSTVELYQDTYIWDNTHVATFLEGSGIAEPVFDKELLDRYLRYLGVLPGPYSEKAIYQQ
ncbi:amino acid adenylation domain-containing protein/thioester reductase-like protein [Chitinophaga sp. W3I9]|uniref:non-ribosomal peptide synthetase family protein n=1 Tax=Chitinophaga sp. W3I9 TaxID=3373924 RepID=UPI003D217AE0